MDNELSKIFQEMYQEITSPENQERLLNDIKKRPLIHNKSQRRHPTKIRENIDFLEILAEFARDPKTDKTFFIPEKKKMFIDTYYGPKNEVKNLVLDRFAKKLKNTPAHCIDDYELLFCLLIYILPMQYAHRVTKCLLDEYGTFERVLISPAEELKELIFYKDNMDILMLLDLFYAALCRCREENNL